MELLSLAFDKLLDNTLVPIARQVGYVIFYRRNVNELKEEAKELQLCRAQVQHEVEVAKRNGEVIERYVQKWLEEVNEISLQIDELNIDDLHAKAGRSGIPFQNLCFRHTLSRKMKRINAEIVKTRMRAMFGRVSYPGVPTTLASRVSIQNDIMEALEDSTVQKIGIFGMGGVGKTTLAKEVAEKAMKDRLFDVVVLATVTRNPDLEKIQQRIADKLGLKFEVQSLTERAFQLRERLSMKQKKVLIILDDLWEELNLDEIGIPNMHQGLKILMTSRDLDVLSGQMNTQMNFKLPILPQTEALALFMEKAKFNEVQASDEFLSIATQVTEECAGLPIGIVTIASALRNKTLLECMDVLRLLQNVALTNAIGIHNETYILIKMSYDMLENDFPMKFIFLLCGLMQPNSLVIDLLKNSIGLELFGDGNYLDEPQFILHDCIHKLKDLCLLLDSYSPQHFSMHDVVQDVVIFLASRQQHLFIERYKSFVEWPKGFELANCSTIILDHCYIDELPQGLYCPNLTFLHLNNEKPLHIADGFFEGMQMLKVLNLAGETLSSLPSSICLLSNLRTLYLNFYVSGDLGIIGELKNLKAFTLNSDVRQLPPELSQLTRLQLLDLRGCHHLELIPPKLLSSLKILHELYLATHIHSTPVHWYVDDPNYKQANAEHHGKEHFDSASDPKYQQSQASLVEQNDSAHKASLAELNDLPYLTTLEVHISDEKMLPKDIHIEWLLRYKIIIGSKPNLPSEYEASRTLELDLNTSDHSWHNVRLLKYVEDLHLYHLKGAENVVPRINEEGMPQLKYLNLRFNDEIQTIVDQSRQNPVVDIFPNLESFIIDNCMNIENIWIGSLTGQYFSRLNVMNVANCDKMKSLFLVSTDDRVLPHGNLMEATNENAMSLLQFKELRSLTLLGLPELISFLQDETDVLAIMEEIIPYNPIALFNDKVMLPNLEEMTLSYLPKLNIIWHWQQQLCQNSFGKLRKLEIDNCPNLVSIFPSHIGCSLHSLETLLITDCGSLEHAFDLQGVYPEEMHCEVSGLPAGVLCIPNMQQVQVKRCKRLKYLFPASVTKTLGKLQRLKIEDCSMMDVINIKEDNTIPSSSKVVMFPNSEKLSLQGLHHLTNIYSVHGLNFTMLKSLFLFDCNNLKYLFSSEAAQDLYNLQVLSINACQSVEEIVVAESGTNINKIPLPRVKTLILKNLAKLRSFCSDGCIVQWRSLKMVRVVKCPEIMQYALGNLGKSNLEEVTVKDCPWQKEDDSEGSTEYLFVLSADPYENETILDIKSSDDLISLIRELPPLSFRKLKKLSAIKCDDKLSDFLSVLIRRSHELQHLEVKQCKSLIQVFNLQEFVATEKGDKKYFQQLRTIMLRDLAKLECIWNKDPTGILGLHNLEEMEIVNCGFLKTIISTSLAQHLRQLKELKIHSCPAIEVVYMNPEDKTGKREIVLPELHTLELVLLKNLKRFLTPNYPIQFPSMESLIIEDCPTMDAFTRGFLNAESLPAIEGKSEEELQGEKAAYTKMKNLKLKGLQNIEEIWQGSFLPGSFSELTEVEVKAFAKLKYLVSSNMLPMLKDLEKITVKDCELITEVFKITEEFEFVSTMFSKPSTMVLIGLPKLVHIIKIDYVGSGIFENLQTLVLKSCNSFRSLLFPSSCLHMLTKLEISECNVLEEIIVIKGKDDIEEKMLFTNLKSFVLESLPELSTFCQEAFELPSVEEISIISCPKLKTFPIGLPTKDYISTVTNHFITNQGSFEKLQKLHLANLDKLDFRMIEWNQTMSPKSLCELQELELGQSSELFQIIPSNLLNRVQKLKKCIVRECEMLKFAFDVDEGNHQIEEWLPQLEELVLTDLPHMVVLMQEPKISIFKNLAFLEFVRCSSLKTLFSISIAKNLHQLELLKLYDCQEIKYVLEGNAGNEKVLDFKKLKCLILMYLPKLISFCDEDCEFELPELKIVRVKNIPKMKTFAKEIPKTPKLKEFYITYVSNCWQGDLNKTMEYLQNYPGAENAGHMKVEHTQLNPQTVTDYAEGDDSAIVPASFLEQEESNRGSAQENEDLITEVPEEAVTLAECDSQMMSSSEEKVGVSVIDDDGQLVKVVADDDVVEEILAACERRPGFSLAFSNMLRQVLLQHPVLAGPFRERSSLFDVVSNYELLANVLLVLEERNPSKMSDADFNALLKQLEVLKILGFDHSWVDSLRHRVTNQV